MGNYKDLTQAWEQVQPEKLGTTAEDQYFRWFQLMFLYGIFSAVDSMSLSYHKMLKIQEDRQANGGKHPPAPGATAAPGRAPAFPASRKGGQ